MALRIRLGRILIAAFVAALATGALAGGKPRPPSVSIISPLDGATFDVGTIIQCTGTARDKEDGDLSGSIQWAADQVWFAEGAIVTATLPEGSHVITASVTDSSGADDTASVTIHVVDQTNDPPVAQDDFYEVAAGGDLTVKLPGLTANDTDPENDPLSVIVVDGPLDGLLTVYDDASPVSFRYTPDPGFSGVDTFTYKANDGLSDSNVATVTVAVLPERAYSPPDAYLMSSQIDQLSGYSQDSTSTLDERIDVAGEGVVYRLALSGGDDGKIGIGEADWPIAPEAGLDYDLGVPGGCLPHDNSSLAAYSCYEMTVSYFDGPPGSSIDVSLIMNTGLTGTSGYPSGDPTHSTGDQTNNTFWASKDTDSSEWTTINHGETVTLRLEFSSAIAYEIWDNKVPHSEGGEGSTDGSAYTINLRDRHEISNIGLQVANFDGLALGSVVKIALNVTAAPAADFIAEPVSGPAPLTVDFTDKSTGCTSWLWDFGDGTTSLEQNPSHTYTEPGTYDVSLTVDGPHGSDTVTKTACIEVADAVVMHVDSVAVQIVETVRDTLAEASVIVVNHAGDPVEGATVTVAWSGDVSGTATATTDPTGLAVVTSPKIKTRKVVPGSTTFTATVTDVTKDGAVYDPGANEMESDSETVPVP